MQRRIDRQSRKRGLLVITLAVLLCVPALGAVAQSDPTFGTQVVRQAADLVGNNGEVVGQAEFWNTRNNLMVEMWVDEGYFKKIHINAGLEPPPGNKNNPILGAYNCQRTADGNDGHIMVACSLKDEFDHTWGSDQLRYVAINAELKQNKTAGSVWVVPEANTDYANSTIEVFSLGKKGWGFTTTFIHPRRGHFIDSPVGGLTFETPTNWGVTDGSGAFDFFPGEVVDLWLGSLYLGSAPADQKISPLDVVGAGLGNPAVVNMAMLIQSLDADHEPKGGIDITPSTAGCFDAALGEVLGDVPTTGYTIDLTDDALVDEVLAETMYQCQGLPDAAIDTFTRAEAAENLDAGISESGIFRKNISKEPDYGATKIKLDIMPVYVPGLKSDGTPSFCVDEVTEGVSYQEWRVNGEVDGESCDPRVTEDGTCLLTEIDCREVSKPIVSAYMQKIDLDASNVTTDFADDRFAHDIFVSLSRDDGTTWKRSNVSRMGDLSSFDLETGEPFPGTSRTPAMKVVDNNVLTAWTSTYCKSGNPRYSITTCDDPATPEVETPETGCALVCRGDAENGTEVCEPDYPYDDQFVVDDLWGVSGQQRSVDYNEVDDVADLEIGEIPYSCLWTARGTIVTQAELDNGTFDTLNVEDDPGTTDVDETATIALGDIVWFKAERLTSGRRDAFFPIIAGTRNAGFAITWQEDPEGLRPGKGKGPGVGWSGAISNHKTDIWYSFIEIGNFSAVDENFISQGPGEDAEPNLDASGFGRPKALVPFTLPIRVSDNNMINTDTLKVELGSDGLPVVDSVTETYIPLDEVYSGDGQLIEGAGTTRYAYLAKDDPLYDYYTDRGGTLDLCDTSATATAVLTELPGTAAHERWYFFENNSEQDPLDPDYDETSNDKTVCISSDGRLLDGDVGSSRPNMSIQKGLDGNFYILLAYEESKGMGDGHETEGGEQAEKEPKLDYGKNLIYHSFEFNEPDLVSAGHIMNLPATCGAHQVYQEVDDDGALVFDDDGNPSLTCTAGEPVPLNFPVVDDQGDTVPGEAFMQYRTEIARRVRFIAQPEHKMIDGDVVALAIFKQGLEGQGRPADVYIRRIVPNPVNGDNPYAFENFECGVTMQEAGYEAQNSNVWGEPAGDILCWSGGETGTGGDGTRGHYNLTSSVIDEWVAAGVDAGPDDNDDPTDDTYGTQKILLWHQEAQNIDDESFENYYSNSRSHRGFIRDDYVVIGFSYSPNWAAARNGRDRYNFYVRRSFDGGRTWTTTPAALGGEGVLVCPEYRTNPETEDPDGSGNLPPDGVDDFCMDVGWDDTVPFDEHEVPWLGMIDHTLTGVDTEGTTPVLINAGDFEPARNVSMIMNNHETDMDPRVAATPPVEPLDGRVVWKTFSVVDDDGNVLYTYKTLQKASATGIEHPEDTYIDSKYFVAWGTGENATSTGGTTITPESTPLDLYYTRSSDWGDSYLMVPWNVNPQGGSDNWEQGEFVYRYDFLAHGDPEQGEAQLRSTADGSKMYGIYHEGVSEEEDPDAELTRWYPWEPEITYDNDVWFRRVIFWPEEVTTP